jgi:hypothetical protein
VEPAHRFDVVSHPYGVELMKAGVITPLPLMSSWRNV